MCAQPTFDKASHAKMRREAVLWVSGTIPCDWYYALGSTVRPDFESLAWEIVAECHVWSHYDIVEITA